MSTLTREHIEVWIRDNVTGPAKRVLLDHDLAQRALLRQREEELAWMKNENSLMAAHQRIDNYQRQIDMIDDLRAQLAAMTAERDCYRDIFGDYDEPPSTLDKARCIWVALNQRLAASQAQNERLTLALRYLSDLGGGNSEGNSYAKASLKREGSLLPTTERPPA